MNHGVFTPGNSINSENAYLTFIDNISQGLGRESVILCIFRFD